MEILKLKILNETTINEYLKTLGLGKSKINSLIDGNKIKCGKTTIKQNMLLKKDDVLFIDIKDYEKIDYEPIENDINILYEDDYLLIINKPKGIIIYDLDQKETTLANHLRYYYQINNINRSIRHVHRLDKDTDGCILYAKDFITHAALSKMLENDEIKRIYHAEVEGRVNKKGTINKNIGKDRHNNNKMIICDKGVNAVTHYKLLEYKKETNTSILEIVLETGRTHQIRVHFMSEGHPLLGDKIYNSKNKEKELKLQSYSIHFIHPITKIQIDVSV
jgi:23S rRNA pseudouridine1911/1915/1917 synthase